MPGVNLGVVTLPIGADAVPWMPFRMPCSSDQSSPGVVAARPRPAVDSAYAATSASAAANAVMITSGRRRRLVRTHEFMVELLALAPVPVGDDVAATRRQATARCHAR